MTYEIPHGTYNGAQAHYRKGEKPCDACKKAKNEYQREPDRMAKARRADATRKRRKAQSQAVTELVKRHKEEYLTLLRSFL